MKTILVSALALGALTSVALAEPLALSDVQLDTVTAGASVNVNAAAVDQIATGGAGGTGGLGSGGAGGSAGNTVTIMQTIAPPEEPAE